MLTEVDGVPAGRAWYFCNDLTLLYSERENRYCICGALEEPTDNAVFPFEMTFASAEVQVSPYNACAETVVWENPWCYLRGIALSIAEKADLPGDCCNAAEKEQLSLLRELAATYGLAGPEGGKQSFDALKRLARKKKRKTRHVVYIACFIWLYSIYCVFDAFLFIAKFRCRLNQQTILNNNR